VSPQKHGKSSFRRLGAGFAATEEEDVTESTKSPRRTAWEENAVPRLCVAMLGLEVRDIKIVERRPFLAGRLTKRALSVRLTGTVSAELRLPFLVATTIKDPLDRSADAAERYAAGLRRLVVYACAVR